MATSSGCCWPFATRQGGRHGKGARGLVTHGDNLPRGLGTVTQGHGASWHMGRGLRRPPVSHLWHRQRLWRAKPASPAPPSLFPAASSGLFLGVLVQNPPPRPPPSAARLGCFEPTSPLQSCWVWVQWSPPTFWGWERPGRTRKRGVCVKPGNFPRYRSGRKQLPLFVSPLWCHGKVRTLTRSFQPQLCPPGKQQTSIRS